MSANESELPAYEEAKENLDEKDLLFRQTFALEQCLQELHLIRLALSSSEPENAQFECTSCTQVFGESELESHARRCKNWSESIGPIEREFERI